MIAWPCALRSAPAFFAATVTLAPDRALKLWLLYVFEIGRRGTISVTPFSTWCWHGIIIGSSLLLVLELGRQITLTAVSEVILIVLAIWAPATLRVPFATPALRIGRRRGDRERHRPLRPWRGGRFALFYVQVGEKPYKYKLSV